jgi:carboxyl-terminal processing protease
MVTSKMMRKMCGVAAFLAVTVGCARGAPESSGPLAPLPQYGRVARQMAAWLPKAHLQQEPLNDVLSARAWTNYLASLDYDRSFFLQTDIDRFDAMRLRIDDAMRDGDVQFAYDVFGVFKTRVADRYQFATNLLAKGFDFTAHEAFDWKRKDAAWPRTPAERDEIWRLRVKNEYLAYVVARDADAIMATNKPVRAAATTNAPPAVPSSSVATNAPQVPTPEEFVRKRYEQYKMVLDDSDAEWVLQRYLASVTAAYDPHSEYMSPARVEDFNIDMNLALCGIGAILRPEDGAAKIVELIPGGPAARDTREIRLRPGDKIIGVGQDKAAVVDVLHQPLNRIVQKIRGKKGTRVVLSVVSASDAVGASARLVDLVREEVKLEEQAATSRVERVTQGGVERCLGVLRLPAFYGTMQQRPGTPGFRSAALDVQQELAKLNAAGVQGIVLDLRSNGGGSLREAVLLTGLFIRSGPVVQVRETSQIHVLPVPDQDPAVAFRKPMVLLVNRISASASEIVAGALQDYGRAMLVGDSQTHGKGSVQTVLQLGDEKLGSLKVTTANYYRVSGGSTQLRGVTPDIVIPSTFDAMDLGEDKLPNALPWTSVEPAVYAPVANLAPLIPQLRARSAQRLAANSRYGRYCRLVQHIRDLNGNTRLPLDMDSRKNMALAEREVRRLQEAEEEGAVKGSVKDDVVLDESLGILSDMIDITGGAELPLNDTDGDMRARMMKIFGMGVTP